MEYFVVRYDSRVVIYEHKMFIRLATGTYVKHKLLSRLRKGAFQHSVTTLK